GILAGAYANVHPKPRPAGHATAPCWKRNEIGGMAIDIAFESRRCLGVASSSAPPRSEVLFVFPLMRGKPHYCCNRADLSMAEVWSSSVSRPGSSSPPSRSRHQGRRPVQTGPRISSMTGIGDRTARLLAIASATERIEARSFTIDGEAVVLGF